ncbi:PD-(D/E)XK nuclease family protein, partial [bacterium]|nr:PD-(D/E)XK nuclease family protein [bacterium]
MNKYIQCPFRFKCHNDKDVKAEFIATPESFVGKVIHLALENFFDIKKIPINERKNQDIAQMIRHLWVRLPKSSWSSACWNAKDRKELFGSIEQEKAFGLKAIAILKNYISRADLSIVPLSLEDWMQCNVGEFMIAGRIDRIDQTSESSISVWDYKTGTLPFHDTIEKIIKDDLQVPIYAIIASKLNPFAKKIKAGLIYIKYSKVYDITWTKEELKEIENK